MVEGYRIPKDRYYLRDPGLTPDELAALRMAASVVQLEGLSAREGLLKLGGLVGEADGGLGPGGGQRCPAGNVGPLFGAIAAQVPVRFGYRGEARTVDPYRLDFQRGRWYLSGFDHARADERVFRLDRFESAIRGAAPGPASSGRRRAVPGVQLDAVAARRGRGRWRPGCWSTPPRRRGSCSTWARARWSRSGPTARWW